MNLEKITQCPECGGYGYTIEHDPSDPHIDGICSNCPIQVQCHNCEGTGINPELPKMFEDVCKELLLFYELSIYNKEEAEKELCDKLGYQLEDLQG